MQPRSSIHKLFSEQFMGRGRKQGMHVWLAVLMLLAAGLCLGWADSFEGIRAAAAKVNAVQADFVQEKHLPILAKPLVSTGRLYYRCPDALRWEYTAPVKSVLMINDGEARRFVESEQGVVEDSSVRMQAMQVVMPEISGWLSGRFQDNPLFDASLSGGNRILLVPRDKGMGRFIERIELVMANTPGVIQEVMIYESAKAFTRMVFSNIRVNPSLDDRLFKDGR
jgi:outer membrane lipoprotein-sorting protein